MKNVRDWQQDRDLWIRVLKESTGEDVATWNRRIEQEGFGDEQSLRAWLAQQGVTGYAQSLLVREHFGYPDFMTASADQLIEGQYTDRAHLRPVWLSSRRVGHARRCPLPGLGIRRLSTPDAIQSIVYQIRLKGHLGRQWTDWFGGLTVTLEDNGDTLLTGLVVDQAALFGLLKKVRDLGMLLVSVNRIEPGQAEASDVNP